jgi:zinc transporter ZupT
LSMAAVFTATRIAREHMVRITVLLSLAIPLAAGVTAALSVTSAAVSGLLTSIAGGVLVYMATAHLLPEAQAEHPRPITAVVFLATLLVMTLGLFTVLAD